MRNSKINNLIDNLKNKINKNMTPKTIANVFIDICKISKLPNNQYYCMYGIISEGEIKKVLLSAIDDVLSKNVEQDFRNIYFRFDILSHNADAFIESLKDNIIPIENGYILIENNKPILKKDLMITPYRLPINYNPNAEKPINFLKWLNELFDESDIKGFQEYMGYCLIPTTKAQKMLLVLGNGGEGKSIIGQVLKNLLGDAWVDTDIHSLCEERFTLSTLDYKLVAYQDDTDERPLKYSSNFKKLITNQGRIMAERKGVDKYETIIYSKFINCSNHDLKSLCDNSDGFYRRIYPIRVKPKPDNRKDDRNYAQPILKELEGILNWCIEGLIRLQKQNYEFSISKRSLNILNDMEETNNSIKTFINYCLSFENKDSKLYSKDLYLKYCEYCNSIGLSYKEKQSNTKLTQYIKSIAEKYNFEVKRDSQGTYFKGISINAKGE